MGRRSRTAKTPRSPRSIAREIRNGAEDSSAPSLYLLLAILASWRFSPSPLLLRAGGGVAVGEAFGHDPAAVLADAEGDADPGVALVEQVPVVVVIAVGVGLGGHPGLDVLHRCRRVLGALHRDVLA